MYKLYAVRFDSPNWHPGDGHLEIIHLGDYDSYEEASKAQTETSQSGPFALDDRWAFRITSD